MDFGDALDEDTDDGDGRGVEEDQRVLEREKIMSGTEETVSTRIIITPSIINYFSNYLFLIYKRNLPKNPYSFDPSNRFGNRLLR